MLEIEQIRELMLVSPKTYKKFIKKQASKANNDFKKIIRKNGRNTKST